jgi:hypothetical protein
MYSSMKRVELQRLCRERGLKANGKNQDLASVCSCVCFFASLLLTGDW